ncbi:DNA polymerase III subunit beta [Dactylosporangium sp. NPDC000244]|uniref:DNA polymerase III subunit beta n=1 Tax=Dactylosporangium sp. NPDC000244 TaxID=3154365 RepID=UPI0033228300
MTAVLTQLACAVDQAVLKAAVAAVAKRLPSRPALPTLACVKLTVDGDRLSIAAFDYDTSATAAVSVDGRGDGQVLVSGRLLSALTDTLPAKPVALTVDNGRLKLTCGTVKLGFPTLPVDEYPQLPDLPPAVGTVDAAEFARAVKRVAAATGPDAEPKNLIGLWFSFDAVLTMLASDRYRAAAGVVSWQASGEAGHACPPAHLVADTAHLLSGRVTLYADDALFGMSDGNLTVVTAQLTDHPGERLRSFFDGQTNRTVELDAEEFAGHVGRAAKVHEKATPIILDFADGGVAIRATGEDSTDADAAMDCDIDGGPIEIRINPDYLTAAIKAAGTGRIALRMGAVTKPVQVLPVGDDSYRHLIVPIRKQ